MIYEFEQSRFYSMINAGELDLKHKVLVFDYPKEYSEKIKKYLEGKLSAEYLLDVKSEIEYPFHDSATIHWRYAYDVEGIEPEVVKEKVPMSFEEIVSWFTTSNGVVKVTDSEIPQYYKVNEVYKQYADGIGYVYVANSVYTLEKFAEDFVPVGVEGLGSFYKEV